MKVRYVLKGYTGSRSRGPEYGLDMELEDFEAKFRKAFHREMTPEEKRFFHLAEQLLRGEVEAEEPSSEALWPHPATDY